MPISIETRAGKPVYSGGIKIFPFARSVGWQSPKVPVGFIWNRAVAVLAVYPDGREEVIPVRDYTRRIELTLVSIVALWFFFGILSTHPRNPTRRSKYGR